MIKAFRQPMVHQYIAQVFRTGYVSEKYLSRKIHSRNIHATPAIFPTRKIASILRWGK